jgi:hypothetical protein
MADRLVARIREPDEPPGPAGGRLRHSASCDLGDREATAVRPEQRPGRGTRSPLVRLDDLIERDALLHQPLQQLGAARRIRCVRVVDAGGDRRVDVHARPIVGLRAVRHQRVGTGMP